MRRKTNVLAVPRCHITGHHVSSAHTEAHRTRQYVPVWDNVNAVNAPTAKRGMSRSVMPPKTIRSSSRSDLFTIVSIGQRRTEQNVQNRFPGTRGCLFNHF